MGEVVVRMMLVEINPGSDIWYNPMHVMKVVKVSNAFSDTPYVRVDFSDGRSVSSYDSIDVVRRRINAGLRS